MKRTDSTEREDPRRGDASLSPERAKSGRFLSFVAWLAAIILVACAAYLAWHTYSNRSASPLSAMAAPQLSQAVSKESAPRVKTASDAPVALPAFNPAGAPDFSISRHTNTHTIIPTRSSQVVTKYVIDKGDSIFEIATKFNIKPETVLWANYDQLKDNPDLVSLGMELQIPPVNGVYYQWQAGDTLESVAGRFGGKVEDILNWAGNNLDLVDPQIEPGTWILIPGGHREFRQWVIPTIPRGRAGVSKSLYGAGTCEGGYGGANGTGSFVWPAGNHYLSGNDYWSGHLGIDIAAGEGAPIYAADSGVVVFAGWATGGYGNMVMIDHGNGYQTLYGHMSSVGVGCGQSVGKGGTIGYSGSTGNSTGAHLHFEVRYQGGFINPWTALPAP